MYYLYIIQPTFQIGCIQVSSAAKIHIWPVFFAKLIPKNGNIFFKIKFLSLTSNYFLSDFISGRSNWISFQLFWWIWTNCEIQIAKDISNQMIFVSGNFMMIKLSQFIDIAHEKDNPSWPMIGGSSGQKGFWEVSLADGRSCLLLSPTGRSIKIHCWKPRSGRVYK